MPASEWLGSCQLKVFLAGRVAVETDGVVIDEERFPGRQGRLLFAYLVAEQGRPVPRDELAEALWGRAPPATWDKALTVIVSKLRGLLADHGIDGANALTSAFGCYRLDLPEGTLGRRHRGGERGAGGGGSARGRRPGRGEGRGRAGRITRAAALPARRGGDVGRGEAARVRRRPRPCAERRWPMRACVQVMRRRRRSGPSRRSRSSRFARPGYRRLMEAHAAAGNRAEALRVYERCRRLLADELGAYPSPETESIYRGLLAGARSPPAAAEPARGATAAPIRRRPASKLVVVLACAAVAATAAVTDDSAAARAGSPGGSRSTGVRDELGANAVVAVDSSTRRIAGSAPLGASPGSIAYGDGSVWVTMSESGRGCEDRPHDEHRSADDPGRKRPRRDRGRRRLRLGREQPRRHRLADRSAGRTAGRSSARSRSETARPGSPTDSAASGWRTRSTGPWCGSTRSRGRRATDPGRRGRGRDRRRRRRGLGDERVDGRALTRSIPARGSVTATINVGNGPVAVAVGPGAVWVANSGDGTVSRVDPATNRVAAPIQVGEGPSGVAVAPTAAASGSRTSSPARSRGSTRQSARSSRPSPVGDLPQGVASSGNTAYVAVRARQRPSRRHADRRGREPAGVYRLRLPKSLDPAFGYTAWELLTLTNDGLVGYGRVGRRRELPGRSRPRRDAADRQ